MCIAGPVAESIVQNVQQAANGLPIEPGSGAKAILGTQSASTSHPGRAVRHAALTRLVPVSQQAELLVTTAAMDRIWSPNGKQYQIGRINGSLQFGPLYSQVVFGLQAFQGPERYSMEPKQPHLKLTPLALQTNAPVDQPKTLAISHFLQKTGDLPGQVPLALGYVCFRQNAQRNLEVLSVRELPTLEQLDIPQWGVANLLALAALNRPGFEAQESVIVHVEPHQSDLKQYFQTLNAQHSGMVRQNASGDAYTVQLAPIRQQLERNKAVSPPPTTEALLAGLGGGS
jgi:hypothetical protein